MNENKELRDDKNSRKKIVEASLKPFVKTSNPSILEYNDFIDISAEAAKRKPDKVSFVDRFANTDETFRD